MEVLNYINPLNTQEQPIVEKLIHDAISEQLIGLYNSKTAMLTLQRWRAALLIVLANVICILVGLNLF